MVTVSVMVGSDEVGLMVLTPPPGILNLMVSAPETRLVTAIASRRVHSVELQPPVPESPVELMVKVIVASIVPPCIRIQLTSLRASTTGHRPEV
jgi:hypothetical protein